MDNSLEERLAALESHIVHLEHQHEQLNEVVVGQARVLARIQKELMKTSDAVETIELDRIRANNPKPPHYQ
ncbi:MAG TPA: SlyX family protein [Candidatus Acidoferrum sp.]|nr:SlyX family protein [Candidatus Acidoferrum sp.]